MTDNANRNSASSRKRVGMGCSLALVVVLIGAIAGAAVGVPRLFSLLNNTTTAASAPVVDASPLEKLAQQRTQAQTQLSSYGWVDQDANLVHIPIDRAMALVAESGLPVGVTDTGAADGAAGEAESEQAGEAVDGATIDFERDVLPIFMQSCAECHGEDDPEEGLVLTSYADVMAGSVYGSVVKPGDAEDSYLVELIETGQMPKRGDDLSEQSIATIVAWINAGAQEHATASSGTATLPAGEDGAEAETVDLANVSFQADVLPIFTEHCAECHGDDDPEDGLVLTSYDDVMAGSVYGSVIKPNDPEGSYLVEQVETGQMPKRGDDLTQTEIDIIVAWVDAGAPDN